MRKIKWGIIGCGIIAENFTKSLLMLEDAELYALASRTPGKAEAFGKKYNVSTYYNTYEALVEDPEVDVVYVATTHNFHYENAMLCLNHGKHVLCEKTFTMNAKQADDLRKVAKKKGLFLMEAMWTRFLPATREICKIISEGIIGEVMFLQAELSFKALKTPESRLYNKNLAGGALLDVGIYPISLASMIFGSQPANIKTNAYIGDTEVDERSTHIFEYEGGKAALINASISYYLRAEAIIAGTKGTITVPTFLHAQEFTVKVDNKEIKYNIPCDATGKGYEAQEVMDCIKKGKISSHIMPIDETVRIMETLDSIREQWGFKYPEEMEGQSI